MQINGAWSLCDDGAIRPVVYGEVRTGSGRWLPVEFLMDTGADRTVLSAALLEVFMKQTSDAPSCRTKTRPAGA